MTWLGILLFGTIFLGGFHPTEYLVDIQLRSYAWALCALFGVWGLLSWVMGRWKLDHSVPSLWVLGIIVSMVVIGGIQSIPLPSSFVASISPVHREIQQSFQDTGLKFPDRIPFATSPEKASAAWDQTVAMLCFFIGVCALTKRRTGAISMILMVIVFSVVEGLLGVLRFSFSAAGRSSGMVFNPNHHAAAVVMGLPLAMVSIAHLKNTSWGRMRTQIHSRHDILLMLTAIVCISSLGWLLSMSRSSLIAGTVILAAWWVIEARVNFIDFSRRQRITFVTWFRGLPLIPILVPCICFVLLLFSAAYLPKLMSRFDGQERHLFGRMELWSASLKGLAQSNFLGLGLGGAEFAMNRYLNGNTTRYAPIESHNDYVQVVTELGILMAVIGFVCIVGCLRSLWIQEVALAKKFSWAKRIPRRALFVGVLITLVHSFTDFHLRIPVVCLEFLTLLALMLNTEGSDPITDKSGREKIRKVDEVEVPFLPPSFPGTHASQSEHLIKPVAFGLLESVSIDSNPQTF